MGVIFLFCIVMQMIQRWIFYCYSYLIKSSVVVLLIFSKVYVLLYLCVVGLFKLIVWFFFFFVSNMYIMKILNFKFKFFMYSVFSCIILFFFIYRWEFKVNYEGWLIIVNFNLGFVIVVRMKVVFEIIFYFLFFLQRIKDEVCYVINDFLKVMCSCRNVGRNFML